MAATRKRKAAADVSAPKTVSKTPRKRARQIRNWLAFIRPHADRYESLPRGEQRKLIEKLVQTTGSGENTLRRYIAAARVLEAHGIREMPAGRRFLPVATIEAIERVGKKDPARGRELFAMLLQGGAASRQLKAELAKTTRRAKRSSGREGAPGVTQRELSELVRDLARKDSSYPEPGWRSLTTVGFDAVAKGRVFHLFARAAAPRFAITLPLDRHAAIFDESVLAWTGGPALITREFLRNIAVAVAMFDYVVVLCDMLMGDVEGVVAEMSRGCRDRIAVRRGRLDLKA